MAISYKKLWKLLIDKEMNKSELQKAAGISWASITKLNRGENIGTDILLRICKTLQCDISEIMEIEETNDK
jgi:Predicted transcriptional regulator